MKIETGLGINPKYVKIAIWIVVAVVVFIIARKAWKWYKQYQERKDLEKIYGQGIIDTELTLTDQEFAHLAQQLYGALNDKKSGWRGVNQEAVYEVFKNIKSASDLMKLANAFGTKTFDFAWTSRAEDGDYTFEEVMRSRVLTDSEKQKIRDILAANGVKFAF